jgi:hypothetical protein
MAQIGPVGFTVLETMHAIARQIADDERAVERSERDAELAQGLAAADETREQASDTKTGALVSGGLTMLSGGADLAGAASLDAPKEGEALTDAAKVHNQKVEYMVDGGKTLQGIGQSAGQLYGASAENHAADAQTDQAVAKADGHDADEAEGNRKEADRIDESIIGLTRDIQNSDNEAKLAILRA